MAPHARHEDWIVADSEVWLDAEFLAAFRAEWAESGADVLTAAYRVQGMRNWPERLDAAAVLLTLLPGLAVLRAVGAIGFTLGACTAVRRGDVAVVGGWPAFGGVLAEDNRLGAALAAAGRTIRLSARLVSIESDLMGWRAWWRHQRRVAVTYRLANPAGFAGSIVTHGEVWALLLAVVDGPGGVGWLAAHILVRTLVAWRMGKRLGFSIAGLLPALVGASVAATGCWVASWFTASLWWGGREWRVGMWPESSPEREFDCPKEAVPP
jgi:ceramide glucosyltransferase